MYVVSWWVLCDDLKHVFASGCSSVIGIVLVTCVKCVCNLTFLLHKQALQHLLLLQSELAGGKHCRHRIFLATYMLWQQVEKPVHAGAAKLPNSV